MKGKYCIVRTRSAGVFAGIVASFKDGVMTVKNARRLWYWSGAASLSQLSQCGTNNPSACKFPREVPVVYLTEVIEVIPASKKARESIAAVNVWEV